MTDLRRLLCATALCVASLPAQNLLKWDAWLNTHPKTQKVVSTKTLLSFGLTCPNLQCNHKVVTGVAQQVTVPFAGLYQFNLSGRAAEDGSSRFEVTIGAHTAWKGSEYDFIAFSDTVYLRAGTTVVRMVTGPDVMNPAINIEQPTLTPAVLPTVDAYVTGISAAYRDVYLNVDANILAVSLGTPSRPITIPGMTHGLDLDPASMVILATSVFGKIRFYLQIPQGPGRFPISLPRIYYQAATFKGFGSRGWL